MDYYPDVELQVLHLLLHLKFSLLLPALVQAQRFLREQPLALLESTPSSAANSAANSGFTSALFLAAVFLAAAFLTGFFSSTGLASGYISMSLRTTGASTVDDAERTNSPISWSFARTTLLSIPSCFANSCTRTFDTFLLSWPAIFILDIYLGMRALVLRPHNLNELI
jgi:hypothetical protein